MRYSAHDKTEIIRLVEQSHLPTRRTLLETPGIPRSSFYRWYDRYQRGGPEGLADRPSRPDRGVWNRIPEGYPQPDCRPGAGSAGTEPAELAVRFTGRDRIFPGLGGRLVYRLLKAHDLITSLSQDHGLGAGSVCQSWLGAVVLSLELLGRFDDDVGRAGIHGAGRLLALHCRLEALCDYEGEGRYRHARSGVGGLRSRSNDRCSPTAPAVG